jgi:protein-disulfide isomerase
MLAVTIVTAIATSVVAVRTFAPSTGARDAQRTVPRDFVLRVVRELDESDPASAPSDTVLVFTDYQCPACRALAPNLRRVAERSSSKALILVAPFPIEALHLNARALALRSLCVGRSISMWERDSILYALADSGVGQANDAIQERMGRSQQVSLQECAQADRSIGRLNRLTTLADELPV